MFGDGYPITRIAISASNGPKATLFAPAAKEIFGLGGIGYSSPGLARYGLRYPSQASQEDAIKTRGAKIGQGTVPGSASAWSYVIVAGGLLAVLLIVGVIKV